MGSGGWSRGGWSWGGCSWGGVRRLESEGGLGSELGGGVGGVGFGGGLELGELESRGWSRRGVGSIGVGVGGRSWGGVKSWVNGSTPNLVSLLRPWIRCFTMIISAWWNLASSKLKKSKENSTEKLGNESNSLLASLDSSYS